MLHLCLFAMIGHALPVAPFGRLGQLVLDVQLQGEPHALAPRPVTKVQATPPSFATDGAGAVADVVTDPSASISVVDTGPRVSAPATENGAGLRNQLLGELRTHLSRYLTYPSLARNRGWEGTVLVGLRIESDGRLEKIRVEHGSGYAVLDHSAVNSLNRLQRLAEAPAWLAGRHIDMQLPIIYRLTEP